MKKTTIFFGFLLGMSLNSWSFSLEDAIGVASTNNPEVMASRAAFQSALSSAFVDRGELYPQVGIIGNARLNEQEFDMETDSESYSIGVRATQHLYAGGRYKHQFQTLRSLADQASNQWLTVRNQMVSDLAAAYMNVLRDREVLHLQEQLIEVLQKQLDITKTRNELGEAIRSDVMQAESGLAGAEANVAQAKADLMISKTRLRRVLGYDAPEEKLVWPNVEDKVPAELSEALSRAKQDNPSNHAAKSTVEAMEHQLKIGQARRFPGLDLVAQATQSDQVFAPSEEYYIGVELDFPLFSGAKLKNRVSQYEADLRRAEADLESANRNIEEAVIAAWQLHVSANATRTAFEKSVLAAEQVSESFKEEYKAGERTIVDVLKTDQDLLEARVNVTRARRDIIAAATQLITAMGTPYEDLNIQTNSSGTK